MPGTQGVPVPREFPHSPSALDIGAPCGWCSRSWSGLTQVVWVASKFPAAATKMTRVSGEAAEEGRITRMRIKELPPGPAMLGRMGTAVAP